MVDDVLGQGFQRGRAVHRVDDGHGLLDPLTLNLIEAGHRLIGSRVEFVFGHFARELHGDQPGLEVDRHSRTVGHGARQVVGVDDATEDLLRVALPRSRGGCR